MSDRTAELQAVDDAVWGAVLVGEKELLISTELSLPDEPTDSDVLRRATELCEAGVAIVGENGYVLVSGADSVDLVGYFDVPVGYGDVPAGVNPNHTERRCVPPSAV